MATRPAMNLWQIRTSDFSTAMWKTREFTEKKSQENRCEGALIFNQRPRLLYESVPAQKKNKGND